MHLAVPEKDVPLHCGPDHRDSPHSIHRRVDYEELFSTWCMQIATSAVNLDLTAQKTLGVRIVAYSVSCIHLELLNGLLLGGSVPYNFLHHVWKKAVQDYLDGKPHIEITNVQGFQDVMALLPPGRHSLLLIDKMVLLLPTGKLRPSGLTVVKEFGFLGRQCSGVQICFLICFVLLIVIFVKVLDVTQGLKITVFNCLQ